MHNPPALSDFDGDAISYEKCYDAYNLGYLYFGQGKRIEDNPFKEKTDENWFYVEGYQDSMSDVW